MCLLFFEAAAANQVVVSVWKIARSGNSRLQRNKIRQKVLVCLPTLASAPRPRLFACHTAVLCAFRSDTLTPDTPRASEHSSPQARHPGDVIQGRAAKTRRRGERSGA